MWTPNKYNWHKNQLELEKFMVERIIQRCDNMEIISQRHRTTSSYTIVEELIKLCKLIEIKPKTIYALISVLNESVDKNIGQNIVNDPIIKIYFEDLKNYIIKIQKDFTAKTPKNINLKEVREFLFNLKKFKHQLTENYFNGIRQEILSIDFKNNTKTFDRRAKELSILLDLLITYVVHKGYSISSFFELFTNKLKEGNRITSKTILSKFKFINKETYFLHRFTGNRTEIVKDFIEILKTKEKLKVNVIKPNDITDFDITYLNFNENDTIVYYKTLCIDPQSFARNIYDNVIKDLLVIKDRNSLAKFNSFFYYTYFGAAKRSTPIIFNKVRNPGDPINIFNRNNTLLLTYQRRAKEFGYKVKDNKLPIINDKKLNNSIYYYHLAIRSKSIENSLSLLWTSLESLLPYRNADSDIVSIQNFVSNSLSIGAISRDLEGFNYRLVKNSNNSNKDNLLLDFDYSKFLTSESSIQLFNQLINTEENIGKENCCILSNESNLLAFTYSTLGKKLSQGNLKDLLLRIKSSELSIKYQLQRIYTYRNSIVHSGDMVSEYTNLWLHLEWYLGKLLFYAILKIEILNQNKNVSECFRDLEAERDYLLSYLNKNKDKPIKNISIRINQMLLKNSWQSF